jgi:hypothetical protein
LVLKSLAGFGKDHSLGIGVWMSASFEDQIETGMVADLP